MGGVAIGGGLGTVVILVLALYFGLDPSAILQGNGPSLSTAPPAGQQRAASPEEERLKNFDYLLAPRTPAEMDKTLRADIETFSEVVKLAGLRAKDVVSSATRVGG